MNWTYTRRWLGMALALGGTGLVAVHYMDYGWTAHLAFPDHGIVGAILFIIGVALGLGKPGTRAKPPGKPTPPVAAQHAAPDDDEKP